MDTEVESKGQPSSTRVWQFRLRDALLLMACVAMLIGWWLDRTRQANVIEKQRTVIHDQEAELSEWKQRVEQYQNQATRSYFDGTAPVLESR